MGVIGDMKGDMRYEGFEVFFDLRFS
jgi:hypothetical protein